MNGERNPDARKERTVYSGSGTVIELPGTKKICIDLDKCVGCLRCELACSAAYTRMYNPLEHGEGEQGPRLRVFRTHRSHIEFKDNCPDCDICVRACLFGALTHKAA